MSTDNATETPQPLIAVGAQVDRGVGRLEPERDAFYYDDASEPDEPVCQHCRGDGMDPECDWLLPCPACQGEQRP